MRYQLAHHHPRRQIFDVVLPDFVLTDRDPPDFVEVWGLPGRASYEARKARKVAHTNSPDPS